MTVNEQAEATREALKSATALSAKRANEATRKVSTPSAKTKRTPAVKSAESNEGKEGGGSADAPNRRPQLPRQRWANRCRYLARATPLTVWRFVPISARLQRDYGPMVAGPPPWSRTRASILSPTP